MTISVTQFHDCDACGKPQAEPDECLCPRCKGRHHEGQPLLNNAERTRRSKTLEDVAQELRDLIRAGWEYPDAQMLLADTYRVSPEALQQAYDQAEQEDQD